MTSGACAAGNIGRTLGWPTVMGDSRGGTGYAAIMSTFVGTSGFSYPKWNGIFYPEKLPASRRLSFYATQFSAVEINNTFYRMPTARMLDTWRDETPGRFVFAMKAPRTFTHVRGLQGSPETEEALAHFTRVTDTLGRKRGPVLFQLPPTFKADVPRLRDFLTALPREFRAAFEFRHASWFDDRVYAALHAANAALCIADTDELATPWEPTADWGYLRLRRLDYNQRNLEGWARLIEDADWETSHVFFKHEDTAIGPKYAKAFQAILIGAEGPVVEEAERPPAGVSP
jgi:uncharacterized protein YecE (DUF72 family)